MTCTFAQFQQIFALFCHGNADFSTFNNSIIHMSSLIDLNANFEKQIVQKFYGIFFPIWIRLLIFWTNMNYWVAESTKINIFMEKNTLNLYKEGDHLTKTCDVWEKNWRTCIRSFGPYSFTQCSKWHINTWQFYFVMHCIVINS